MVETTHELPLSSLVLMPEIHFTLEMDPARDIQVIGKLLTRLLCGNGCTDARFQPSTACISPGHRTPYQRWRDSAPR